MTLFSVREDHNLWLVTTHDWLTHWTVTRKYKSHKSDTTLLMWHHQSSHLHAIHFQLSTTVITLYQQTIKSENSAKNQCQSILPIEQCLSQKQDHENKTKSTVFFYLSFCLLTCWSIQLASSITDMPCQENQHTRHQRNALKALK